jgi:hypothetical protein
MTNININAEDLVDKIELNNFDETWNNLIIY